jgi:hypothetical protein
VAWNSAVLQHAMIGRETGFEEGGQKRCRAHLDDPGLGAPNFS